MSSIPYVFYSYSFIRESADEEVNPRRHFPILRSVQRTPIAYRKAHPSEADRDTMLVVLKDRNIHRRQVLSFYVSKRITERTINTYIERSDEFSEHIEETNDCACSFIVALPSLKKMAVQDRTGEHNIDAKSALGRLKKIISEVTEREYRLYYEYAASARDVRQALSVWNIEEVSFSARPFNPHPSTPGDRLSELMADNNSNVSGRVKAREGFLAQMEEGIIGEVIGLSERGYAELGARGRTERGYPAQIGKSNPYQDVNTPMKIRLMLPERAEVETHVEDIIEAMVQIYG